MRLFDGGWAAKVIFLHGHPAAAVTHILHGCQFILAHMLGFNIGRAAETALLSVAAGIAQMPGGFGHGTATFTGIRHNLLLYDWR
jgi:hypothetical protein